ncbi:MAG TPA: pyridine nucleotide-disulfide oxidoreductase, partial [Clostridiales bacterium]|nr:pyridine nucleotide-disulfide oxidoreductase [Clostridiales bacterium]
KNLGYERVYNLSGGYRTYQLTTAKQSNENLSTEEHICSNDEISAAACSLPAEEADQGPEVDVDACGLQCPGPLLKLHHEIRTLKPGGILRIRATDPAFEHDLKVWCQHTGNELVSCGFNQGVFEAAVRKSRKAITEVTAQRGNAKTMVVFSNDLDKALATFIIANGAAAMGRDVTLFFTFWGLNILRKPGRVKVKKDLFGRMFGMMMPRGTRRLSLSKMNMLGIGPRMIRFLMRRKNVYSMEDLLMQALENGVKLVACNMSMDLMGIQPEELIDGVTLGGVASMLGNAEDSDMTLFV